MPANLRLHEISFQEKLQAMRAFARVVLSIFLSSICAAAQAPPDFSNDERPAALPASSGTPEPQAAPELLPDSKVLPGVPTELRSPSAGRVQTTEAHSEVPVTERIPLSPEEQAKIRARLSELRAVAERTPRATNLLKLAAGALSDEAKREFMRAYYYTVCTEMRRLDPKLLQAIGDYERGQIRRLAQGPSRLAVVSRKSQRSVKRSRAKPTDR
jgi:hypothetical protein